MRRKHFFALSSLVLLLFLLPAALTRYAAAAEQGTLTIADCSYRNGTLSFTALFSGVTPKGQLTAAVFSENNVFKTCVFYPAQASVEVQVSAGSTDTVKIAWLDDSQRFLAPPDILRMDQSGGEADGAFTAQLHQLLSGFNPASGAESAREDDPYYLQRLIVRCDELPDLTGRNPSKILKGPDGLFILSFKSAGAARTCAEYLRKQAAVLYVEPDRTLNLTTERESESAVQLQGSGSHYSWGVEATGIGAYAESLRERGLKSTVTVAVVDSGVDANHPFLSGRLLPSSNTSTEPGNQDDFGHGTHVAGIIVDCMPGLDVKILPVKVMNRFGSFTTLSLIGGIYEAASRGANVINLSLSAPATEEYQAIEDAVRYAVSQNITVVAAAGNQNTDTSKRTPACMEECVTVSAVQSNETRYGLSNYGDAVDLTAPGVAVNSSIPGGLFDNMSGTSMAAPHVSAAAALLLYERGTTLTPTQISKSLCNAARRLKNQTGWQPDFGSGMLDLTPFIKKTAGAYALLYSDGELVFQTTDTPTAGRTVTKVYPIQTTSGGNAEYAAWYDQRKNIKTVTFAETIQPVSTALWFYDCGSLTTINGLDNLDTSKVTDMSQMFADCSALTELDLTAFRTENVTNMTGLFLGCTALKTILVSDMFTTGVVTSSRDMFKDCASLVGGSGTKYDSSRTDKSYARIDGGSSAPGYFTDKNAPKQVFAVLYSDGELAFQYGNQAEYGKTVIDSYAVDAENGYTVTVDDNGQEYSTAPWYNQRPSIQTMSFRASIAPRAVNGWFYSCGNLTEINNIRNLDTSNAMSMYGMFGGCYKLASLDLGSFDTSHVTEMGKMFCGCNSLASLDLGSFDTSLVTDMGGMFDGCRRLASLDLGGFDTSHVTNMTGMFFGCNSLASLDLGSFDTSFVTYMDLMFFGCNSLASLDLGGFDTSLVTTMYGMFYGCRRLTSLDLGRFDTSKVWNMSEMFYGCSGLVSLDLGGFDTSFVKDMGEMFYGCSRLASLDLGGFDTSKVWNMGGMFVECIGLSSLDVSRFDTSKVTFMNRMFSGCSGLTSLYASEKFLTAQVTEDSSMFSSCTSLVGGSGTKFDSSHTDKTYARIDGGPSAPGYFTAKGGGEDENLTSDELFHLGEDYFNGANGKPQDYQKSIYYYKKSADKGNMYAMNDLGYIYQHGYGTAVDYAKALDYYEQAAALGNPHALNNLGYVYENGLGVTKDYQKAMDYYQRAADAGSENAATNLLNLQLRMLLGG